MKEDLAIKEIREVREKISKKFSNSPKKLVEHYIDLQEQHKNKVFEIKEPQAEYNA